MKIGELAKRAGVAASAIRFYEASGLLEPAVRGSNGYRVYDEGALERLQVIQLAQRLGMSLEDLRAVFVQWDGEQVVGLIVQQLQARLQEIDRMQQTLVAQRNDVEQLLSRLEHHRPGEACPVLAGLSAPKRAVKPRLNGALMGGLDAGGSGLVGGHGSAADQIGRIAER